MMKPVVCVACAESTETTTAFLQQVKSSCSWKCVWDAVQGNHPTGHTDSTCLRNTKGESSKYLRKLFCFLVYCFHRGTELVVYY